MCLQKAAAAGEKQPKKKAAKEDTAPKIKKARSAYIFFSTDKRAQVKGAVAHRLSIEHQTISMVWCMLCLEAQQLTSKRFVI